MALETTDWMLITCISAVLSGMFCAFWMMLGRRLADRRITLLEAEMDSVIMTLKSRKGEEGRAKAQEEEAAFMAQAASILKEEGDMGAKLQKIIALNPGMAMKLGKKLGIGL